MIPPPFPFTAFVLTSGAIGANAWTFLVSLAIARFTRFGLEAGLAAIYGRRILRWMESPIFDVLIGTLIGLAVVGTVVSAILVAKSTRRRAITVAADAWYGRAGALPKVQHQLPDGGDSSQSRKLISC